MVLQQKRYIKMTGVTLWYARQIVWCRGMLLFGREGGIYE